MCMSFVESFSPETPWGTGFNGEIFHSVSTRPFFSDKPFLLVFFRRQFLARASRHYCSAMILVAQPVGSAPSPLSVMTLRGKRPKTTASRSLGVIVAGVTPRELIA